eukprot:m.85929 g.85929  ORF g.85929 m.85929 type:complete len:372 (+) comp21297_c0_seq2:35-1150(+)
MSDNYQEEELTWLEAALGLPLPITSSSLSAGSTMFICSGALLCCGFICERYETVMYRRVSQLMEVKLVSSLDQLQKLVCNQASKLIPYIAVRGLVGAEHPIKSLLCSTTKQGVIYERQLIEHREVWRASSRSWHDEKKVISEDKQMVPFFIHDNSSHVHGHRMNITHVRAAMGLSLPVIHDVFTATGAKGLTSAMYDYARGLSVKGVQAVEKILPVNTPILAIGQVKLQSDGTLSMEPPSKDFTYFLTTSSLSDLLATQGPFFIFYAKLFFYLTASAFFIAGIRQSYERRQAEIESFRIMHAFRARQASINADSDEVIHDNTTCVICMSAPREVTVLECGHYCMCRSCGQQLTHCPICRRHVTRLINTFAS